MSLDYLPPPFGALVYTTWRQIMCMVFPPLPLAPLCVLLGPNSGVWTVSPLPLAPLCALPGAMSCNGLSSPSLWHPCVYYPVSPPLGKRFPIHKHVTHPCNYWNPHRSGYISPAFSGAQKRAELLHHHWVLGGPHKRGQNQKWLHHPCLQEASSWAESLPHPCVLPGPHKRGQNQKWLHHPCVLGGLRKIGQNQKWLHHPCLLGGPQVGGIAMSPLCSPGPTEEGTKSKVGASPVPSWGPTSGQNCYITPMFSRAVKRGEKIKKWLNHPCLLRGPQLGGIATSPLCSRGSP